MARPKGELCKCDGKWTQAQFNSFIKNNLRSATRKWGPINTCKKAAHVGHAEYLCAGCGEIVPPTIFDEDKGKRVKNIFIDHIIPIIDPSTGFTTWDDCIDRMFCDSDNLQLLCKKCHDDKSQLEINEHSARRLKEKNDK